MIGPAFNNQGPDKEYLQEVAQRFERMMRSKGHIVYFDTEDFEDLFYFYLDSNKFNWAEQVLSVALQQHPNDDIFHLLRTELLIENNHLKQALAIMDAYPHPEETWWCYQRFRILVYLHRPEQAVRQGNELLALKDGEESFVVDMASVLLDCHYPTLAGQFLMYGLQLNAENPDILSLLGRSLLERGDGEQAMHYASKALEIDPYKYAAWLIKGYGALFQMQPQEGLDAFEYALAINPDDYRAWMAKMQSLLMLNRLDEVEKGLEYMSETFPRNKDSLLALYGDLAYARSETRQALAFYAKAVKAGYKTPEMLWRMADSKAELHRWKDALALLNELLSQVKTDVRVLGKMADIYMSLGNKKEALKMHRKCIAVEPEAPQHYLACGTILLDMGDRAKAYTMFHKAYKMQPDRVDTNFFMALISAERNEPKRLQQFLQKACSIVPEMREHFFQLCPEAKAMIEQIEQAEAEQNKKAEE